MNWLRRNLAALIAIPLALTGLAYVLLVVPIAADTPREGIVTVKQGDTIEVAGYSVTLIGTREFVGTGRGPDNNNVPLGTSLVAAVLEVQPGNRPDDTVCDATLTSRVGGTERSWHPVSSPSDFDYGVDDDSTTVCLLDGDPFVLEAVFLAPEGAYDSATVDFTVDLKTFRFVPDRE